MAHAFNLQEVDPDAFINDQRQGEGKGGDRGISLQIIDDVLSNSKGLFEEQGLGDDIAEKLKQLWISKLESSNEGKQNDHLRVLSSKIADKNVSRFDCKETESIANLKRRKKGQRKVRSLIQEGENIIEITATNLGSTPPNTSRIEIVDSKIKYPIITQLELNKTAIIKIVK